MKIVGFKCKDCKLPLKVELEFNDETKETIIFVEKCSNCIKKEVNKLAIEERKNITEGQKNYWVREGSERVKAKLLDTLKEAELIDMPYED